MKTLSEEQIYRSLQLISTTRNCDQCEIRDCQWGECHCERIAANAALELLDRKNQIIQDLNFKLDSETWNFCSLDGCEAAKKDCWKNCPKSIYNQAKFEAYKEFSEKLKFVLTLNNIIDDRLNVSVDSNCLIEAVDDLRNQMCGEIESDKLNSVGENK